ncbi:hypothetical protein BMT55_14420 [Listeria newyorkensis]|uniref:Bacterial Ig domain-containing protein n=1 Tax=Listeria newyorkensis TaxID=1497681 RepID=A0ABX4XQ50_9LIST|nr:hypothetical protein [Listeria newyorkensis]KGL43283.1 hypothetical protein EP58_08305 [Listeria newyorkensis]PNP88516.1 hypothetical protein BMT55_14420 [Listeria newyorkensis]WAO22389.1 hypothetical protein OTR81_03690 [Listeria newyorkensis]SQC50643.1 Uncharacterised protein [Listeria newyorkensis]
MIELALICVFIGLLAFFVKKKSFKKGMSLFLAISLVGIILAGCGAASDELTKEDEPTTVQKEKTPKLVLKSESVFKSDENGTVTITGKTTPNAELTLVASGQSDQTATSDSDGNFSFEMTEVHNDGTAVLTTTWKGQNKSKDVTYQANPTYKAKVAKIEQEKQVAEAKRVEAEKQEQARIAEAQRVEAARIAEEKRVADQEAATEKARIAAAKQKEREAAEQREAAQRKQAEEQQPADNQGEMVYITATGKRYHFDQNCRGLNNSNGETQVTLSDAQSRGLTKCKFE